MLAHWWLFLDRCSSQKVQKCPVILVTIQRKSSHSMESSYSLDCCIIWLAGCCLNAFKSFYYTLTSLIKKCFVFQLLRVVSITLEMYKKKNPSLYTACQMLMPSSSLLLCRLTSPFEVSPAMSSPPLGHSACCCRCKSPLYCHIGRHTAAALRGFVSTGLQTQFS